jgi:hypothetical protein
VPAVAGYADRDETAGDDAVPEARSAAFEQDADALHGWLVIADHREPVQV